MTEETEGEDSDLEPLGETAEKPAFGKPNWGSLFYRKRPPSIKQQGASITASAIVGGLSALLTYDLINKSLNAVGPDTLAAGVCSAGIGLAALMLVYEALMYIVEKYFCSEDVWGIALGERCPQIVQ